MEVVPDQFLTKGASSRNGRSLNEFLERTERSYECTKRTVKCFGDKICLCVLSSAFDTVIHPSPTYETRDRLTFLNNLYKRITREMSLQNVETIGQNPEWMNSYSRGWAI